MIDNQETVKGAVDRPTVLREVEGGKKGNGKRILEKPAASADGGGREV